MKKTIKPLVRQTLTDLAVVYFGSAEKAVEMAKENDIQISQTPPKELPYSVMKVSGVDTAAYFRTAINLPATELNEDEMIEDGINFMQITENGKTKNGNPKNRVS